MTDATAGERLSPQVVDAVRPHSEEQRLDELPPTDRHGTDGRWRHWPDVAGYALVVAVGILLLLPALVHGAFLGPYDQLAKIWLTAQPHAPTARVLGNGDIIDAYIPWSTLVWQQVHQGHLPLWNPYGGLGTPLAANWQSAPLSLAALVGYLLPLHYAFTAGVVVNVLVAGTGGYFLGRVMGLGRIGAATVGTTFELSGPFAAWLGYSATDVMSFGPWILAFGLLALRRQGPGPLIGLAIATFFAICGGYPEATVVLGCAAVVFFLVVLASRAKILGGSGPVLVPGLRLAGGGLAGAALSLPFSLPALALTRQSVRNSVVGSGPIHLAGPELQHALPVHTISYLLFQDFEGLPLHGSVVFGASGVFYTQTAAYIGVVAVTLCVLAVALRSGRAEVRAFLVVAVLCLVLVWFEPAVAVADKLPVIGGVQWFRALLPASIAFAALAGFGADAIATSSRNELRRAAVWLAAGFGVMACVLVATWFFGRGGLTAAQLSVREHSFIWPVAAALAGSVAAAALLWASRPQVPSSPRAEAYRRQAGPVVATALLAANSAFLLVWGAPMVQSSPTWFPQTPAATALQSDVGSSIVASGAFCGNQTLPDGAPVTLGIEANVNDVYGVHDLNDYDAMLPAWYFSDWQALTRTLPGFPPFNLFCPAVASVSVARMFGVGYLLEAKGVPGPPGTVLVGPVGNETLYRVPGSGQAVLVPLASSGPTQAGGAQAGSSPGGVVVPVVQPDASTWVLTTDSARAGDLQLHLTNLSGWTATVDGHPLVLRPFEGMMLQATLPPGHHVVRLSYWPETLTVGIVVASLAALGLVLLVVVDVSRRRRRTAVDSSPSR